MYNNFMKKTNIITCIIIAIISGAIVGLLTFYIYGLKITNRVENNSNNIQSIVEYINKNIVTKQPEKNTAQNAENNTGE